MTLQSHSWAYIWEKYDQKGYVQPSVHRSPAYNSQGVEAIQTSMDREMDKDVEHIHNRILLSH